MAVVVAGEEWALHPTRAGAVPLSLPAEAAALATGQAATTCQAAGASTVTVVAALVMPQRAALVLVVAAAEGLEYRLHHAQPVASLPEVVGAGPGLV